MMPYQSADQKEGSKGVRAGCLLRLTTRPGPVFQLGHMIYEPPSIKVNSILEALLTGASVAELQPRIDALLATERAAFLCSTCAMIDELVIICHDVGVEAERVLVRNCRYYEPGNVLCHATCERDYPEPPTV